MLAICQPLLLLRLAARRGSDQVEAGTLLGWPSPRKNYKFDLRPGTTTVFYTNGLVENRNRGLDAGLEELTAIAALADQEMLAEPERLLDYLVERMLQGHEQDDDITLLAIRYQGYP